MASRRSSNVGPCRAASSPAWRARKQSLAAHCHCQLLFENLERRLLLAADWQNAFNRLDVSDNGLVTPLDALVIINELNLHLDMEKGGDCASNFRRLYDYLDRRLQESNQRKEEAGNQEVIRRLTVLRNAWAEMLQKGSADGPAGSGSVDTALFAVG